MIYCCQLVVPKFWWIFTSKLRSSHGIELDLVLTLLQRLVLQFFLNNAKEYQVIDQIYCNQKSLLYCCILIVDELVDYYGHWSVVLIICILIWSTNNTVWISACSFVQSFKYHRLSNSSWDLKISDKASSPHPRHQHRADWCRQRYHLAPCTPKPHTSWSGGTTAERAIIFVEKGSFWKCYEMLVKLPKIRNSPSPWKIRGAFGTVYSAGNEGISFVSFQTCNSIGECCEIEWEHGNKPTVWCSRPTFCHAPAPSPVL